MKFFKGIFRNSSVMLKINAVINNINFDDRLRENNRRKGLNIMDFEEISKPLKMLFVDKYPENNLYGMSSVLLNTISGNKRNLFLNAYIEHGLFLGNHVASCSYLYPVNTIITFSDFREEVLLANSNIKKTKKRIEKIGPYIAYANSILDKETIINIKEKLGKTLLVFPTHSINKLTTNFNNEELISEIERIKVHYSFDTVLISLYWKDIQEKGDVVNEYQRRGYKIVCSGNINDIYFLSRQRTIIELADMTMSNEVGTHVGYCIYLGKPHYIFSQEISFKEGTDKVEFTDKSLLDSQIHHKKNIEKYFNNFLEIITDSQRNIIDYYWGIPYIKTKEELKKIL